MPRPVVLLLPLLLAACGQTGPLYLPPPEPAETPAPAAEPAAQRAPAQQDAAPSPAP